MIDFSSKYNRSNKSNPKTNKIECIIDILQKVYSSIKAYLSNLRSKKSLPKDKPAPGLRSFTMNYSSTKLSPEDCKFLEKLVLKLKEYPNELGGIIYLVERGIIKIGKQTNPVKPQKSKILMHNRILAKKKKVSSDLFINKTTTSNLLYLIFSLQ